MRVAPPRRLTEGVTTALPHGAGNAKDIIPSLRPLAKRTRRSLPTPPRRSVGRVDAPAGGAGARTRMVPNTHSASLAATLAHLRRQ